jgi:hypothetical protein
MVNPARTMKLIATCIAPPAEDLRRMLLDHGGGFEVTLHCSFAHNQAFGHSLSFVAWFHLTVS